MKDVSYTSYADPSKWRTRKPKYYLIIIPFLISCLISSIFTSLLLAHQETKRASQIHFENYTHLNFNTNTRTRLTDGKYYSVDIYWNDCIKKGECGVSSIVVNSTSLKIEATTGKGKIVGMIAQKSYEAGLSPILSLKLAFCESSYNPKAVNPNSTASGLFMFTKPTWKEGVKKRGLDWKWGDVLDAEKNLDMAIYYLQNYGLKKWDASKKCRGEI
jgi:hypothetical protein